MAWMTEVSEEALRALRKLDPGTRRRIVRALRDLESLEDPRARGKALTGNLRGYWRYRVGDWRIICEIVDSRLVVIVIDVAHRSRVYR